MNAVSRVEREHGFIETADCISFKREETEIQFCVAFTMSSGFSLSLNVLNSLKIK